MLGNIEGQKFNKKAPVYGVVYLDQLSGAAHTQKLVKLLFSAIFHLFVHFKPFSVISRRKSTKKHLKTQKKV